MERIINKYTYCDVKEVVDRDDIVITNDLSDDTANKRVNLSDKEFDKISGHSLINYYEDDRSQIE